jgi:MFS family permease
MDRRPFVLATFSFFALFPLAVALSHGFVAMVVAFVVGGLREIGEAPRKALIVDLARAEHRAQDVGAYYLVRGLVVMPGALIGGLLWNLSATTPFWVASAIGTGAVLVFAKRNGPSSRA